MSMLLPLVLLSAALAVLIIAIPGLLVTAITRIVCLLFWRK